jgi:hypothetical protein
MEKVTKIIEIKHLIQHQLKHLLIHRRNNLQKSK